MVAYCVNELKAPEIDRVFASFRQLFHNVINRLGKRSFKVVSVPFTCLESKCKNSDAIRDRRKPIFSAVSTNMFLSFQRGNLRTKNT